MWKMFSNVPQVIAELLDQSFLTKPVDLARFGTFGLKNNTFKNYAESCKKCWKIYFTCVQTISYPLMTNFLKLEFVVVVIYSSKS